jgi:hypothetical protein
MSTADVLAVPKAGLTQGQRYLVFGTNLEVERCFGDQATCEVAVISSRCADAGICKCRSDIPNRVTTFYYSRDLGVTAFFTKGDVENLGVDTDTLMDALPLLTYVLVGKEGFLKMPLGLPRAKLKTVCR